MNISAGQRVAWPFEAFRAKSSDLLASMDGVVLFRIPADLDLPGIAVETVQRLDLALLATRDNSIHLQPAADTTQGMLWLQKELQSQEIDTPSTNKNNTYNSMIELLDAVHQRRIQSSKIRFDSHTPLSSDTATDLFLSLELTNHDDEPGEETSDINHVLLLCIAAIQGINVRSVLDLKNGPSDPRRRLQLLLEQNSLIGREVLMSEDSLDHNCGDLIAFAEDDSTAPVYLKSTPSGYQIWAPLSMRQPRPIWDCRDLLSQLSPRMVAVSPALTKDDLSTVGLIQFAFGRPINLTRYIVSGLLVGLAMGFVHRTRCWRITMDLQPWGHRNFSRACLGVVSGGFRSGIAVMAVGTGLAILTPAFNTVLTAPCRTGILAFFSRSVWFWSPPASHVWRWSGLSRDSPRTAHRCSKNATCRHAAPAQSAHGVLSPAQCWRPAIAIWCL